MNNNEIYENNSSNPPINTSNSIKRTTKKKRTKNISSPILNSNVVNSPVVSFSKLDSIIEHEFANKIVTRSMQQEAKKKLKENF